MKILYVGDNRNRENWGCRATSIALKDLISENNEIIYTLYGDVSSDIIPFFTYCRHINQKKIKTILYRLFNKVLKKIKIDYITSDIDMSARRFKVLASLFNPYACVLQSIIKCDALVFNGEGAFIFKKPYRRDSAFYLLILKIAQGLNKKTYCLNAMFSDCPESGRNLKILNQAVDILSKCTLVSVREKESYRYLTQFAHNINIKYTPDALFSWVKYEEYMHDLLRLPKGLIPFVEEDNYWNSFDFSHPYICISGSSSAAWTPDESCTGYVSLVQTLKKITDYKLLLVPTCSGDRFLHNVAKFTRVPIIPVNINILGGMSILANATVFISGRWHPSILASLGGTPCVFLGANSHKTGSLQEIMEYEEIKVYHAIPAKDELEFILNDVQYYIQQGEYLRNKIKNKARELSELTLSYRDII
jgi:polysaccharide pyruvyl transferase WcaK-like protein